MLLVALSTTRGRAAVSFSDLWVIIKSLGVMESLSNRQLNMIVVFPAVIGTVASSSNTAPESETS